MSDPLRTDQWNLLAEKLPPTAGDYLIRGETGKESIGNYSPGDGWAVFGSWRGNITHWAELAPHVH
jgi:hypothetical protein